MSKKPKPQTAVVLVDWWEISPSPENDQLYRPVSEDDPAIVSLSESIKADGLLEPVVLSTDLYIISGHRRFAACRLAGMAKIPCRIENVSRRSEPDRFLTLLRRHNQQRVKSLDEQIRESIIDSDPAECRAELIEYRRQNSKVGHVPLLMGDVRARKRISQAKAPFMRAIQQVLNDRRKFWPLSVRQIHYALLNNPPLKHASKPDSIYRNDAASYKSLVELATRMRLEEIIPFDAIGDETRPFTSYRVHREPGEFVEKEINEFLKDYYRDLMQSQPNHVEIVVEKNTVGSMVKSVAIDFCIPVTSGRGYCSIPPRRDMAVRFQQSGKSKLVVLLVSDFDPDGEAIAETFARSMRDDFGIDSIHPIKVALTFDQVQEYNLPPSMEAKATSSRTPEYVKKYGQNVWELEALPPETLQDVVRDAIGSVINEELFRQEQQAEESDVAKLRAVRETIKETLGGIKL